MRTAVGQELNQVLVHALPTVLHVTIERHMDVLEEEGRSSEGGASPRHSSMTEEESTGQDSL